MLLNYILINNYSAVHLVNNKLFFKLGTFKLTKNSAVINAETTFFFILEYNKRVIKNMLLNFKSIKNGNLILTNIALIKRFYVNLISKARFRNLKI